MLPFPCCSVSHVDGDTSDNYTAKTVLTFNPALKKRKKVLSYPTEDRPFVSLLCDGWQLINVYRISAGSCAPGALYLF